MKKFFTLVAMACMAIGVQAQSSWRPDETAPAAGTTIVDDDLLTVKTVFETTNAKAEVGPEDAKVPVSFTIGEKTVSFNFDMQVRVDAAPTAAVPEGTDKGGSTPLIITAKKDVDITVYYRRQQVEKSCGENDGKDLKLVDQAKPATALTGEFGWVAIEPDNTDYAYAIKTWKLEAGKTYTMFGRGTTIRFYGIDYVSGSGAEEVPLAADGTHFISFDGQSAANILEYGGSLNGFKLQITGNTEKTFSGAKSITIGDKTYTTMKVSNGAQNTLTLPEGKVATGITFYSYVNKDEATERPSYWKEVAGMQFDETTIFENYGNAEGSTPDKREFSFKGGKLNEITFTNTGEQCCFVIEIAIETGEVVPIPADVESEIWTVVGGAPLLGSSWDLNDESNLMTTTDGATYTLVKTDVVLEKGVSYEYKAAKDRAWDVSVPQSGNQTLTVEETGKYTVTFTLADGVLTVEAVKTGEAEVAEKSYSVIGNFKGDTNWTTDYDMTKGDDGKFSVAIDGVAAGSYEFKVRVNHAWDEAYPSSNYKVTVDADNSTVTVTFDPETKAITAVAGTAGINAVTVEKTGVIYSVAGQKVNAQFKGVAIQNGRKFIVK